MKTESILKEVTELIAEYESVRANLESVRESTISVDKFYNVALTTDVVANLHSVSSALVRKYIKLGLIDTHPLSSDSKLLVRASDALVIDFKELKSKAKALWQER